MNREIQVQLLPRPNGVAFAIKSALIFADESTVDHVDPEATGQADQAHMVCARWFRFGDTLIVEIDTEEETCVVLEK